MRHTFTKSERLCSQQAIDWLFDGKGTAFSVFPFRIVYKVVPVDDNTVTVPLPSLLISVPKKRFHHAVDRNRVKRQVREGYRHQRQCLADHAQTQRVAVTLGIVYIGPNILPTTEVEQRIGIALKRITSHLNDHETAL